MPGEIGERQEEYIRMRPVDAGERRIAATFSGEGRRKQQKLEAAGEGYMRLEKDGGVRRTDEAAGGRRRTKKAG